MKTRKVAENKSIEVKLELGHRAVLRSKPTAEGFTHDWTVFVRGPEGCNIQHFVDKVVFLLHDSFPKPKRVLKEPPYQVSESGYAGFNMPIEVYFRTREDPKKVKFVYDLYLSLDGTPISNIRCEKLTFHNPPDDFCHKLLKAGGTESNRSGSSTSPAPPSTNASNSPKVKERQRSEGHKKPRLSTDMGKSPSVEPTPSPLPPPVPSPQPPTPSQPFTELFGTPIKRDQLVEKPSKNKDSKSSQKSKSSKSHGSSSAVLPKPPASSLPSKEHKSSSKDKERHKESSKEKSRDKERDREKVRESKPIPSENVDAKPVVADSEKKPEKEQKHKDKTKEKSKSKSKDRSSKDTSSKSNTESKSKDPASRSSSLTIPSRRPSSPPADPPPKKPRPPSPPPEREKKKKESRSSSHPLKESPKKPPPLIPPISDPTPERRLSEADMDLSLTPSPKPFLPSSPPLSRDESPSPTLPPVPPSSLLNPKQEVHPGKAEPISPTPKGRGPVPSPGPPPPSSPGAVPASTARGPLNALMMEMEQEDLLSPLSSPSASSPEHHQRTSAAAHGVTPDESVRRVENNLVSRSGEHIKELKELKSRILNLNDPHRLQAVVDLVEETGLYKMTSATFDFDLCALDPMTLDKLQDCLNGR
ncbi:protein AF-9-like isoform X2 [Ornithodoros turicata]|uniref:protein AF-9-like isoform X2 n=1 Tax=Ornithodoros turicata TaxID=34597 RepID=UPI00313A2560